MGGFTPGGDEATWYPALWSWLAALGITSVLDIGCGEGQALAYFRDLGIDVVGVDGVAQPDDDIVTHDFTEGPLESERVGYFDMVWCCEFVEHVEEGCMPFYLEAFKLAKLVLMTHADPGQQGHHHVNCRTSDYWQGAMAASGYRLDPAMTEKTRELAALNTNQWNHYVRSGMAFRRV